MSQPSSSPRRSSDPSDTITSSSSTPNTATNQQYQQQQQKQNSSHHDASWKRPPPPPPPPLASNSSSPCVTSSTRKRPPPPPPSSNDKEKTLKQFKGRKVGTIFIRKPVILRDVNVFKREHKVGEGTYGSVFMGSDKETGEVVALKRINTEQEENGFPITAIREVKILKALDHVNVVKLKEIVTSKEQSGQNEVPRNVYMVFEYHAYDLTGILQSSEIRITQDHIKSWSHQLLSGMHYIHTNRIIHRDLKCSNILISKSGELKIADWGLARSWNENMKQLTNGVVTRWYRPIELLLGAKEYSTKIDMWSVGCIIAELFRRDGLLKGGDSEASQLQLIFETCGHPNVNDWPDIRRLCPLWSVFEPRPGETPLPNRLSTVLKQRLSYPHWMTNNAIELIKNLLTYNPEKRWSAEQAIASGLKPLVKEAHELSMKIGLDSVHELEIRKKHMSMRAVNNRGRPKPPT
eukprot:CAMPEP_0176487196 /NCGR_PEP_ID=MMETSP0200_2-20121128/5989_1 /TAXON_ID=947934 /ORGANISM="Chaetoceros sp., Strain GSL56" /LENGTH=462 /DNA_ID=CAMNT_0017883981 /DNA_START=149 /DNA_END=1537 /DNA_ORIENTATION=-